MREASADTIMLDPTKVNTVDRSQKDRQKELHAAKEARLAELKANKREKKKTRGRSKLGKKLAKKESNIMDAKRQAREQQLEEMRKRRKQRAGPAPDDNDGGYDPLSRFASKNRE